ncbi:MAG TPA: sulfotransferase [Rubrobacteraceae bacterium]|nr:sulfotransferase [Rubrobacteraceae bacterium]
MKASFGSRVKRKSLWHWRRAAARYPRLAVLRRRLAAASLRSSQRIAPGPESGPEGVDPSNIVWIFCVARSGSTWLAGMMGALPRHEVWREPRVGHLFGEFYEGTPKEKTQSANFIMGAPTRGAWISSIRHFVLVGARHAFPRLGLEDYLVIKEPGGGVGAPFLMEALPESRMILLVRDPRDVVSSSLDATRKDSWQKWGAGSGGHSLADERPNAVVRRSARKYLRNMNRAREAFDAHGGPKALVRYEDLRADALGTMRWLYSTLEMAVGEEDLARAVQEHSWESIPEDMKGQGKFYRKASPGGWREDLTPEQARIVEKTTAPLLAEFYR